MPQKTTDREPPRLTRILLSEISNQLKEDLRTIRSHHGIGFDPDTEKKLWTLYSRSPEILRLTALITKLEILLNDIPGEEAAQQ